VILSDQERKQNNDWGFLTCYFMRCYRKLNAILLRGSAGFFLRFYELLCLMVFSLRRWLHGCHCCDLHMPNGILRVLAFFITRGRHCKTNQLFCGRVTHEFLHNCHVTINTHIASLGETILFLILFWLQIWQFFFKLLVCQLIK
jgi:hypothetical protein